MVQNIEKRLRTSKQQDDIQCNGAEFLTFLLVQSLLVYIYLTCLLLKGRYRRQASVNTVNFYNLLSTHEDVIELSH